jgi:hypothetical protein
VSKLPVDGDGHDRGEAGCGQLLEMHELRRRVERGSPADKSVRRDSMAVIRARVAAERREPIAPVIAYKRRVPGGAW